MRHSKTILMLSLLWCLIVSVTRAACLVGGTQEKRMIVIQTEVLHHLCIGPKVERAVVFAPYLPSPQANPAAVFLYNKELPIAEYQFASTVSCTAANERCSYAISLEHRSRLPEEAELEAGANAAIRIYCDAIESGAQPPDIIVSSDFWDDELSAFRKNGFAGSEEVWRLSYKDQVIPLRLNSSDGHRSKTLYFMADARGQ